MVVGQEKESERERNMVEREREREREKEIWFSVCGCVAGKRERDPIQKKTMPMVAVFR